MLYWSVGECHSSEENMGYMEDCIETLGEKLCARKYGSSEDQMDFRNYEWCLKTTSEDLGEPDKYFCEKYFIGEKDAKDGDLAVAYSDECRTIEVNRYAFSIIMPRLFKYVHDSISVSVNKRWDLCSRSHPHPHHGRIGCTCAVLVLQEVQKACNCARKVHPKFNGF